MRGGYELRKPSTVCLLGNCSWDKLSIYCKKMLGLSWWSSDWDFIFQCGRCRFNPWLGNNDFICLVPRGPNIDQKQYRNKFNKDFKNSPQKSCYILVISIIARSINTNSGAQRSESAEEVLVTTGKARGSRNISGRSIP